MTQDELTLVLDALKWCHGGEPCGTAEAIAVVEKALANVATNDTSKEYVDEMQKQRHETVEDNSQQWKGMDGAIAFHLIERHADGWNDIRKMMGEWLSANTPQRTWQGLTNKDITQVIDLMPKKMKGFMVDWDLYELAQTIEAKLKELNT